MIGMFGELGLLGKAVGQAVKWSPYGTVKHILSAAMQPGAWDQQASLALLTTIGYAVPFSLIGIKWFRWESR